jgi:hypothetical protein
MDYNERVFSYVGILPRICTRFRLVPCTRPIYGDPREEYNPEKNGLDFKSDSSISISHFSQFQILNVTRTIILLDIIEDRSACLDIVLDVTERVLGHLSTGFIDFRVGIANAVYQIAAYQCTDGSICYACA